MKQDDILEMFGKKEKSKPEPNDAPTNEPPISGPEVVGRNKEVEKEFLNELKNEERSETDNTEKVKGEVADNATSVDNSIDPNTGTGSDIPGKQTFSVIISGRVLLSITDATIPRLIQFGLKKAKYDNGKTLDQMMLTDKEIKMLEPMADKVVDILFEQISPLAQFTAAMVAVYGSKI
jgi:hypothetical protein